MRTSGPAIVSVAPVTLPALGAALRLSAIITAAAVVAVAALVPYPTIARVVSHFTNSPAYAAQGNEE